ncbi:MAG: hypothetical protein Q9M28_09780 [Mariprofundaceae bacterium]|nr:hypothetical protein [Mariprofundaceae bacterium]
MSKSTRSSSGHKLGQIVGDWFEEEVAVDLLSQVASKLGLYLDHRFRSRICRGSKVLWEDLDGNNVDYDFVLELGGTDNKKGIPLAYFETFWRRGARHSKDKARDDSGKLMPMKITYPTTRVLGIISAGDFTKPAQELVQSRGIDLFYIPKSHICKAWENVGIQVDYEDSATEEEKRRVADNAVSKLDKETKTEIFSHLVSIVGKAVFDSYIQRIIAGVAAIPLEFRITKFLVGSPVIFSNHEDAKSYLKSSLEVGEIEVKLSLFRYQAIFSDGNIFQRADLSKEEALELHETVGDVAKYFSKHHADRHS